MSALGGLGRLTELRQRLLFVLGALIVFRLGSFVPVPGVNPQAMVQLMEQQRGTIVDMFNMFSGGALERFSLFALSVMPYISASIVVQLLGSSVPSLQALRKEGESGRRKLTQYTRYGTVALAVFQSFGVAIALQQTAAQGGIQVVFNPGPAFVFTAVVSLTAGTLFLMWLGEQITERGIGNGISLLIFAGIVAGLPGAIVQTAELATTGQLAPLTVIVIMAIIAAVTAFVVFVERGQRRITVNYARRQGGRQAFMNQTSHLPLKIN
ncbi:MAG: preprotein translocase subunit SecY, partial [Xanthomonadales bacterium]|nr:preprotein translocase subunit SecY [Xanthomonadales bacterium]